MKRLLPLLFLFAVCARAQEGAEPPARAAVTLKTPAPNTKLAQPFNLTFDVPGVLAEAISYDEKSVSPDYAVISASAAQIGQNVEYSFKIIPFVIGKNEFKVVWNLADGGYIESPAVALDTGKVITGILKNDIVDIRGPYIPFDYWRLIMCLTAAGAAAAVFIVWKKFKNGKFSAAARTLPKDGRPADVIAKERIEKLLASGLWDKREYKNFYIELTDILRGYTEARFNIVTKTQTSEELVGNIKKSAEAKIILDKAREFLNAADLVKFAKFEPLSVDKDTDVGLLNLIIKETAVKSLTVSPGGGEEEDELPS